MYSLVSRAIRLKLEDSKIASPSETKGISRRRDTGKTIDSKRPAQWGRRQPFAFVGVFHLAATIGSLSPAETERGESNQMQFPTPLR